jgi:hypothetical protein
VQEEKDQVRRQDARLLALPKLQDRVRIYAGREKEESAQGVSLDPVSDTPAQIGKARSISRDWRTDWDEWNSY